MKKTYLSIISFVMVLFLGANISATEVKTSSEKLSLDNKAGVVNKSGSFAKKATDPDYFSSVDHDSLSVERYSTSGYRIGTTNIALQPGSITTGDNLLFKGVITESGTKIEVSSYYKKIATNKYAHIRNLYTITQGSTKISSDFFFRYVSNYCSVYTMGIYSGNCTSYKPTTVIDKTYASATSSTVVSMNIAYYDDKAYMFSEYTIQDFYKTINGSLKRYRRIEAPKKPNSYALSRVSDIYYHSNGRVSTNLTYGDLLYSTSATSFRYQKRTYVYYNTSGRMTSQKVIYNMERYSSGKWIKYYPTTLSESRTYYSNGKTRQITSYYRNKSNYSTGARKTVYRSNGKKYSYKSRSYSSGKVSRQYFYRYNAYGNTKGRGSYKITTYYSKGRATKAYKQKYRSSGKGYKAYRVKLTSGVVNF